jgi:class 3 adenylate cyclase
MDFASANQIILSESVRQKLGEQYQTIEHPDVVLKGRSTPLNLWELVS